MATIKGVWVWRDYAKEWFDSDLTENISFASNGTSYTSMTLYTKSKSLLGVKYGSTIVTSSSGYVDEAYKVVDFGSAEQTVSDNFYNNFITFAEQQAEPEPEAPTNTVTIEYNGSVIASLTEGKATLPCKDKVMHTDIVVNVPELGGGGSGGGDIIEVDELPEVGENGKVYGIQKFACVTANMHGTIVEDLAVMFELPANYYTAQTLPETGEDNDICYVESENEIYVWAYGMWMTLAVILSSVASISLEMKGKISNLDEMNAVGYYAKFTPDFYYHQDGKYRDLLYKGGLRFTPNGDFTAFDVYKLETYSDSIIEIPTMALGGLPIRNIGRNAFENCRWLEQVTIPDGVEEILWHAFSGCTGLASIEIPNSVHLIDGGAFIGCTSLGRVQIGSGVQTIGAQAFYGCSSLWSATIPDGVATMYENTFTACYALQNVSIPNTVVVIGNRVFAKCPNLKNITFRGTKAQWNAISKDANWGTESSILTITCTDGTISLPYSGGAA